MDIGTENITHCSILLDFELKKDALIVMCRFAMEKLKNER